MTTPPPSSTIYVKHTSRIHASRPASFGPHLSNPDGQAMNLIPIEVYLRQLYSSPSNDDDDHEHSILNQGCPPPTTHHSTPPPTPSPTIQLQDWVALVQRGTCAFVDKVRHAQRLGASAVIVGDWNHSTSSAASRNPFARTQILYPHLTASDTFGFSSGLLTMYAPGDTSDILIPSVFVARDSYLSLRQDWIQFSSTPLPDLSFLNSPADHRPIGSLQVIMSKDELWTWPFFDLVIMLLFLPSVLTIVTLLLHRISTLRKKRADRAPRDLVNRLPSVIWAKDMEKGIPLIYSAYTSAPPDGPPSSPVPQWITQLSEFMRKFQPRLYPIISSHIRPEQTPLLSSPHPPKSLKPALRKSQPKVYFSQRECALCLSDFEVGDLIRILPCGHCFHQSELEEQCMGIDYWLLKSKRFCPICRMSILEEPESPLEPSTEPVIVHTPSPMDRILLGYASEPIPLPRDRSHPHPLSPHSMRNMSAGPIPSSSSVTLDHPCSRAPA